MIEQGKKLILATAHCIERRKSIADEIGRAVQDLMEESDHEATGCIVAIITLRGPMSSEDAVASPCE